MTPTIRLLPYEIAGPDNMAADETLVETAATHGIASLRFYGWSEATVSLGYFQPAATRLSMPSLAPLPWVRRPSGGATLVHHHELTYCLALPAGAPWQTGESWLERFHRIIHAALHDVGAGAALQRVKTPAASCDVLCFQQQTAGDLSCGTAKVVGSAQRKHRRCLLQHGAILLAQSEHTPQLQGIAELTGIRLKPDDVARAVAAAFERELAWKLFPENWTAAEIAERARLVREKYSAATWNARR